jgi:molybdate transport system substrate-binding protein
VKAKITLAPGSGAATESVAAGRAAFVITLFSEIVPVHGIEVLGALPGEYQTDVRFTAAASASTQRADAVKSLIAFLTGPQAAPILKSKGLEVR